MLPLAELDAAILQAAITLLVMVLCGGLWVRTRRAYFGWWAVAWGLYLTRIGAIVAFLVTEQQPWLFLHQVITGWTALALLWTSAVFAGRARWRSWYIVLAAFPPLWSWVAIYQLQNFLLAAAPAVAFLSVATAATGVMFWRYRLAHPSAGATVLATTFLLWAVHHLDYPILRARGVWSPWGYYLDIVFTLGVAGGILLLINSELTDTLRARGEALEHLSRRMVRQHEAERRRLSLALHDETAQVLAAVKLQLGSVAEHVEAPLRQRLDHTITLVDTSITGIRRLAHGLRPALLDDLGLLPALRSLTDEVADAQGMPIDFDAPSVLPVVAEEGEVALYRALQEGLANVGRHAGATHVQVSLEAHGDVVILHVRDDGRGIDPAVMDAAARGGLAGMRERVAAVGGEVSVAAVPGQGTHLRVSIPVVDA
ncbi:MAG: sensor histidine kinase [Gemmatimonadetes bacterium]|nr:sensor histidine kinase [Gemmatimonadota bacterium]